MRKYKAYEFTLVRYVDGDYSVRWGIRDPNTHYYCHRVGGPAYVEYDPIGTVVCVAWSLEGTTYYSAATYRIVLEEWLG